MSQRVISREILIDASVATVWDAWTTEAGIKSFFSSNCKIEARVGGPIEIYFDMEASPGNRGSEGCVFPALQENRMIFFTWNALPHLPEIRKQRTYVTLYLDVVNSRQTQLQFYNGGYGFGGEWDAVFEYFQNAWLKQVLPNLKTALESTQS